MSNKMTTRIDKQSIIDQAKSRYDNEQKSKLPTEIVDLPSGGKVYAKSNPLSSGKVEIRYMTAYDEDILTNMSYVREGVMFDKLLESIIMSDCNLDDMIASDKDAIVIQSRILAYGAEYPVKITDPETKTELERTVNLSKLKYKTFNLQADELGEFTYTDATSKTPLTIKFSYDINITSNDGIYDLLKQCIREVNGKRQADEIDHFIRYQFLAQDSKRFRTYFADNTPGMDYNYEFEGENGGTFSAVFPIGIDLFWF
jgi:hypothetical protein|tara:strand:- start:180 stop:950 length:771 start_codon:yes stop_codon:yes gene_type:complete